MGVLLKVGKPGEIMATEGTKHAVIEGTLETVRTKSLEGGEMGGRVKGVRTCWQGVVTGW